MDVNNDQYEMLSTQDWLKEDEDQVEVRTGRQLQMYDINALDQDFFPVLAHRLTAREAGDETDGIRGGSKGYDTIDARGTFDRREVEKELKNMHRSELEDNLGISMHKIKDILRRSDVHRNGEIEYKQFLKVVRKYRLTSEQASTLKSVVKAFAYVEEFYTWPPPIFMISITLIELGFFLYHCLHLKFVHGMEITWEGPVPYCSVFIYNPYRRYEAWRFVTYMWVHIGIGHFVFNMIMQLLVGVFLEMEQEGWLGSLRIAAVYLSGVVAGSLGTSITDPLTYVAGASGGVYALIAAHLATLALNWKEDSAVKIRKVIYRPLTRIVRLVFIILLTLHDIIFALYVRFMSDEENRTGFMGHLCGALAGVMVGIFVLDNRRVRSWEPIVQWISLSIFLCFVLFAILWNIFANEWTGRQYYPPQDHRPYDDDSGNCKHYDYI